MTSLVIEPLMTSLERLLLMTSSYRGNNVDLVDQSDLSISNHRTQEGTLLSKWRKFNSCSLSLTPSSLLPDCLLISCQPTPPGAPRLPTTACDLVYTRLRETPEQPGTYSESSERVTLGN